MGANSRSFNDDARVRHSWGSASKFGWFSLSSPFQLSCSASILCLYTRCSRIIFWALIFLQIFGLTALTGVLAIAIPYSGICAKVYAELLEEADPLPLQATPKGTSIVSAFFFVKLPGVWENVKTYSFYRLECGLRSSAVLGFIGLPTLGFYLETAYKEGLYSDLSALLIVFYILISTIRKWMKKN